MTTQVLHLRSAVNQLRPRPTDLLDGQLMLNTNAGEAGVYFRLSDNTLARLGGVHIGTTAPNSSAAGHPGNSEGEAWVDTTDPAKPLFKVYQNGSWFTVSTTGLDGTNGIDGTKGEKGEKGEKGLDGGTGGNGSDGAAATIAVGTTTTLAEGASATVSNTGSSSAAVFDFGIPQGTKGNKGEVGPAGADGADAVNGSRVLTEVHNGETGTLFKGKAVYVSGTYATGIPIVKLADSNGSATYPAIGLVEADIANGENGEVILAGELTGLDTDSVGFDAGAALYVDTTAGDLTTTRPTASDTKVQKVAMVTKRDATNGSLIVMGAGRANDVPNELTALLGTNLNDTDLGTFTGSTISDNSSVKGALQDLETQIETNIGLSALKTALNILDFADDSAAAAGGLGNGDIYWNTTDGKLRSV